MGSLVFTEVWNWPWNSHVLLLVFFLKKKKIVFPLLLMYFWDYTKQTESTVWSLASSVQEIDWCNRGRRVSKKGTESIALWENWDSHIYFLIPSLANFQLQQLRFLKVLLLQLTSWPVLLLSPVLSPIWEWYVAGGERGGRGGGGVLVHRPFKSCCIELGWSKAHGPDWNHTTF